MKTKEEIEILRADALAGDPVAQNDLGCAYSSGDGVTKDLHEAFVWFERSAKQGNKYGQYNTGRYYHYGISVKKDIKKAIEWYEKSALQNFAKAANTLGEIYENGYRPNMVDISLKRETNIVISANPVEAFYWYNIGTYSDEQARFNLARCYESGIGTTKCLRRACNLYKGCKSDKAKERLAIIRETYIPILDTVIKNVELIGSNPYRILGVWSNSSAKEIHANESCIQVKTKVGQVPSFDTDNVIPCSISKNIELLDNKIKYLELLKQRSSGIWLSIQQSKINREKEILNDWVLAQNLAPEWNDLPNRDSEAITIAARKISSEIDRIKYALFWFCIITDADKKAIQFLSEQKREEALDIWKEEKNFSAYINRAVLKFIERDTSSAIANILEVIHNDEYRSHFLSTITSGRIQISRDELSRLFWDSIYVFPESELSLNDIYNLITFQHNITLKNIIDAEEIDYNLNKQFDIIKEPLESLLHSAHNTDKFDFEKSRNIFDRIAKEAPYELLRISRVVGKDNYRFKLLSNEISESLLNYSIHYNNNYDYWAAPSTALYWASTAMKIAQDEVLRERCEQNVAVFKTNKQISTTDKLLEKIDARFKELEGNNVTLPKAEKLLTDISMYVECIKTENGKDSDLFKKVSDNAVNAILNVIISICNRDKDATTSASAFSLLKKLKDMEMSSETGKRLENNLTIISNNMMAAISHRNYGDLGGNCSNIGKSSSFKHSSSKEENKSRRIHKIWSTIGAIGVFALMCYYLSWNNNLNYFMETIPWWGYICIGFMVVVVLFVVIMWGMEFQEDPLDTEFDWIDKSYEELMKVANAITMAGVQGRKTYSWPFAIPFQLLAIAILLIGFPLRWMAKLVSII